MRVLILSILAAIAVLAQPGVLSGQAPPDFNSYPPEVQQQMIELSRIQSRITSVRLRVMQEPEMVEARAEVEDEIVSAMLEAVPESGGLLEQAQALAAELQAAQREGNQARVQEIGMQIIPLSRQLDASRSQVTGLPEVVEASSEYDELLQKRMSEEEPNLEALRAREAELRAALTAAIGPEIRL